MIWHDGCRHDCAEWLPQPSQNDTRYTVRSQITQPTIETHDHIQVDLDDDAKLTERDIPGLQSRWGLAVVPCLAIASLVVFLCYQYPNDAMRLILVLWHKMIDIVGRLDRSLTSVTPTS